MTKICCGGEGGRGEWRGEERRGEEREMRRSECREVGYRNSLWGRKMGEGGVKGWER